MSDTDRTPTILCTRGLPASGKTTWANRWAAGMPGRVRVSRDDLRAMLYGTRTGLTHDQESAVTAVERAAVIDGIRRGHDVVIDAMHLRPRYVRAWRRVAAAHGANLSTVTFPIDVDVAIARDGSRDHAVGADVIRQLASTFMPAGTFLPVPDTDDTGHDGPAPYVPPSAPPAVIVDIDGTVAHHGDRSPYDMTRVSDDTPNHPVITAVNHARAAGARIVWCSGRDTTARDDTVAWLTRHAGMRPDEPLHMRPADDRRRDAVVKAELFDRHIRHAYRVLYVLDDRQQVVDMWRSMGLTVLQVAPGDF